MRNSEWWKRYFKSVVNRPWVIVSNLVLKVCFCLHGSKVKLHVMAKLTQNKTEPVSKKWVILKLKNRKKREKNKTEATYGFTFRGINWESQGLKWEAGELFVVFSKQKLEEENPKMKQILSLWNSFTLHTISPFKLANNRRFY